MIKKQQADKNRGNDRDQINKQHRGQCVSGIFNIDTSEIDCDYVERGFGSTLKIQDSRPVRESTPKVLMESIMNPLDPAALNGRKMATGNASTICLLTPKVMNIFPRKFEMISNTPEFLNKEIATSIPRI